MREEFIILLIDKNVCYQMAIGAKYKSSSDKIIKTNKITATYTALLQLTGTVWLWL